MTSMRVAVVVSRYNASITDRLLQGAVERFLELGGRRDNLVVLEAPGAFELPVLCRTAARSGRFSAVVALGCLIRGQTMHDQHIARAVAYGLVDVSGETGVPVTFGVLTCETPHLAAARAGGSKGNKGAEALAAAVEAAQIIASFEQDPDLPTHQLQSTATDKAATSAIPAAPAAASAYSTTSPAGNR
jgi:6,7-dimethyl-8-ribityllumazine synthase